MTIFTAIDGALSVLQTADPTAKANQARAFRRKWLDTHTVGEPPKNLPAAPSRPEKPDLVAPNELKRRGMGSPEGRAALLHAIAHIELNAIDLAADMIARYSWAPQISASERADFINDWSSVCEDEARHFLMLQERLRQLGASYGDFPAHNGLWNAAQDTAHNFAARLAIAPLVLEARGLDVTPGMIKKLTQVGDMDSVKILEVIYQEEVGHVAIGAKWFKFVARIAKKDPADFFHEQVKEHYKGRVVPPFNVQARTLAGLSEAFYRPLVNLS